MNCVVPAELCHEPINYMILEEILHYEETFFADFSINCKVLEQELEQTSIRL